MTSPCGGSMKATIFIWPEQRGQITGSNSYTRLMSMALVWLARLRAGADSVAAPGRGSRRCCRSGFGLLARRPRALFAYQPRPTFGRCPRIRWRPAVEYAE